MTSQVNCSQRTGKWIPKYSSDGEQNQTSSIALESRSQLGEQPYSHQEQQHIRKAIRKKYQAVANSADGVFCYQTGKKGAIELGYDPDIINSLTDEALNSFCGVGNPFGISTIPMGSNVLDIGCGSGFDLLVARKFVGSKGNVCGIDLTMEMIKKARFLIEQFGYDNISVQHVCGEEIPYADDSFDYVISNGVLNLSPSKLKIFKEIWRVLKPNGTLQFADVSLVDGKAPGQSSSPEDWAQWIGGTVSVRDQITLLGKAGFHPVQLIGSSGFKTSEHTESTLFKAVKPGWEYNKSSSLFGSFVQVNLSNRPDKTPLWER